MSKHLSTNFEEINLEHYLYTSLRTRFQDVASAEFEDFIAYLFTKHGYALVNLSFNADFGADFILKKEGIKTAVQVKRYFKFHKVGLPDIRHLIGAKEYYQCQQALLVTTSSFNPAAKELANNEKIGIWDWNDLEKAICDTFLDGQHHQDYYKTYPIEITHPEEDLLKLEVQHVELASEKNENSLVTLRLTNRTDGHHKISCELPVVITEAKTQYQALGFTPESFSSGVIYSNATVEIIAEFSGRQMPDFESKDRLLVTVHFLQSQETIVLERKMGQIKEECFFVSFYFGRDSESYTKMIFIRDHILMRSKTGRQFIIAYYTLGSRAVQILRKNPKWIEILRPFIIKSVEKIIRFFLRDKNSNISGK